MAARSHFRSLPDNDDALALTQVSHPTVKPNDEAISLPVLGYTKPQS
jgi:hypothetical protein